MFHVDGSLISATTVADNLNMAVYLMILLAIASGAFFRKHYTHPHIDEVEKAGAGKTGETLAASYWERHDISLKDIAACLAYSAIVVTVSKLIAGALSGIILASNANIGGPTTAAGMAISLGWTRLVGPCMLVGTFGYVIGTWLDIIIGSILGT